MKTSLVYAGKPGKQSPKSIQTILEIQSKCFEYDYAKEKDIPFDHWWLLKNGNRSIGFCSLRHFNDEPGTWFLRLAAVLDEYRGHGLQKKMIRHRVKFAKRHVAKRIITYASYDNLPSANSLIRCGFKLYKPRWNWGTGYAYYFKLDC